MTTAEPESNTEGYRSGHNGAVLKTVRAKVHAGSNPAPSAMQEASFGKQKTLLAMIPVPCRNG